MFVCTLAPIFFDKLFIPLISSIHAYLSLLVNMLCCVRSSSVFVNNNSLLIFEIGHNNCALLNYLTVEEYNIVADHLHRTVADSHESTVTIHTFRQRSTGIFS